MRVRPLLQRIRLFHINIALYAIILGVMVLQWDNLTWAWHVIPKYVDGRIPSPEERKLYRSARRAILRNGDLSGVEDKLQASMKIDPNCEAPYWLAEYFFMTRQDDTALKQFQAYIKIDQTKIEPYLKVSAILERKGRIDEARKVLRSGLMFFEKMVKVYVPYNYSDVRDKYNEKAVRHWARTKFPG